MLHPAPRSVRHTISPRTARWLWIVAVLDMMAVAWMLAAGPWLDHASQFTTAVTLGGRSPVVLGLALTGFTLLVGLGIATHGFSSATRTQFALLVVAVAVSVVSLAGGLSAILLVLTGAFVLGLVARPMFRRR